MWISRKTEFDVFELDEIFWFVKKRKGDKNGINTYIMTMISRNPRQIVGFDVNNSVTSERIQSIVDGVPPSESYCTDGGKAYCDVIFGGKHIRNVSDKSDTHNVESVNSDLRHYVPLLARRNRCFPRTEENLRAVLAVFINAYNKFGEAKAAIQIHVIHKPTTKTKRLHKFREQPFSVLNFL